VRIHAEGSADAVQRFVEALSQQPPPAARIASLTTTPAQVSAFTSFEIRHSRSDVAPTPAP